MRALLLLAAVVALGGCEPTRADDPTAAAASSLIEAPRRSTAQRNAWRVDRREASPTAAEQAKDGLRALAKRDGAVRVLVRLDVPFTPEGDLRDSNGRTRQREAIALAGKRLETRLAANGAHTLARYKSAPWVALVAPPAALEQLFADTSVRAVQEDRAVPPTLHQSGPLQEVPSAYEVGATGTGQAVAVLDTGVESGHPFLAGKVVSEACYSSTSVWYLPGDYDSLCPGGVDGTTATGSGADCSPTIDGCGHGTHVAGIAAGVNGGFSGVAKDARIVAIQVFSRFNRASDCSGGAPCASSFSSDQISGLERVMALVDGGMAISSVNMSLGGGKHTSTCDGDALKEFIDNLRSRRVATVIAAGNESYIDGVSSPGCISTAITVGSTTKADDVATYSNSHAMVDLLATGSSIYSSVIGGVYGFKSGTSMATPQVAGAYAALRSKLPNASVDTLTAAMLQSGVPILDARNNLTKPRLRLGAAVDRLILATPVLSPSTSIADAPFSVRISHPVAGPNLRYTVDGSTPTSSSGVPVANGGTVSIGGDTTLKAIAYLAGQPDSRVAIGRYSVLGGVSATLLPGGLPGARWRLGSYVESFERGGFDALPWTSTAGLAWYATQTAAQDGAYSARSPAVADGAASTLSVAIETSGGTVRFAYRVSSESGYDFLRFRVDGVERGRWSGVLGWSQAAYTLAPGTRVLSWVYEKDSSASDGHDTAWVDAISLPGDAWRTSGSRAPLVTPGTSSVTFAPVAGWVTPADRPITVTAGQTTTVEAAYVEIAAPPTFSPVPGLYVATTPVQLASTTPAARIRYTTDGTTPTRTTGTEVASGTVISVAATTRLRAFAYSDTTADSPETSGVYEITAGAARVAVAPAEAVAAGARWRGRQLHEHFETGAFGRLPWSTGGWRVIADAAADGVQSARAPGLAHGESATLALTVESDGGTLRFRRRVSSEAGHDWLELAVDGVLRERWAGEVPWGEVSYPLAAGTRRLEWRYVKDANGAAGADTAWLDAISLPGDAWRTPGSSATQLPFGAFPVTFLALPGWVSPADRVLTLATDQVTETTGTYERLVVATPELTPAGGTFTAPLTVALATATAGATLRYTTDGTDPIETSPLYTAPIPLAGDSRTTLRARAWFPDWQESGVISGSYLVTGTVAAPTFDVPEGDLPGATVLHLATTTAGATIRYTLDGSDPDETSAAYKSELILADFTDVDLRARAYRTDWLPSPIVERRWHVNGRVAAPTVRPDPGTYTTPQAVTFATTTPDAELRFTIDGSAPTATSTLYTGELRVPRYTDVTFRVGAFRTGWTPAEPLVARFEITGIVSPPAFKPAPGVYTSEQALELASATPDATVRYTLDDTGVTELSPTYAAPVPLPLDSTITVRARAWKTGWEPSPEHRGAFVLTGTVATPSFAPAPGLFQQPQAITLQTTTPDATLRYTLDGTDPTEASTPYTAPVPIPPDTRIVLRARAFRAQWARSAETSGEYVVTGTVAAPTFDLANGTYTSPQIVRLATATPSATLRYTTDGTLPTIASPPYSEPLVLATGTNVVLRARAFRPDWLPSPVTVGIFRVTGTVATPASDPVAGAYDHPLEVRLATTTPAARVRYTLDDTDPTDQSPLYEEPVPLALDTAVKLRARAFRTDWLDSKVFVAGFRVHRPLSLVDSAGLPLTSARVEAGAGLELTVRGGSGAFEVAAEGPVSAPAAAVTPIGGGAFLFEAPATGAFAGDYVVRITDPLTGWTAALPVHVPPRVVVARASLLGRVGTSAVTVTGGAPGGSFAVAVLGPDDEPDVDGVLATVTPTVVSQDDAPAGHPAVGELAASDVQEDGALRVVATQATLQATSAPVGLLAAGLHRGRVTNLVGVPVASARVSTALLVDENGSDFATLSDAEGGFTLVAPRPPDGEAYALAVAAEGFLPFEGRDPRCLAVEGCELALSGVPGSVAGEVVALRAGEKVELRLRVWRGEESLLASEAVELVGGGTGRDAFVVTADSAVQWSRLELRAPGFEPLDDDHAGAGFALAGAGVDGVELEPAPTSPEVGPLTLRTRGADRLGVAVEVSTRERPTSVWLELESGGSWTRVGEPVVVDAGSEMTSVELAVAELTCGRALRLHAVAENDREVRAEGAAADLATEECPPSTGCGCGSTPVSGWPLALVAAAVGVRRRRAGGGRACS